MSEVPIGLLDYCRFKPGYDFSADWYLDEGITINIHADVEDSRNPGQRIVVTTPTLVPEDMDLADETLFLSFLRQALIKFAIHEVDEWFRYRGKLVNDPHSAEYYYSEFGGGV